MKVFEAISDYIAPEMKRYPFLDPGFYMDRFSDFFNKSEDVFYKYQEPHKRNFFEITLAIKESIGVNIGETTLNETRNTLEIVSPFQVFSFDLSTSMDEKNIPRSDKAYSIFFDSSFFNPKYESFEIQHCFPFFKIYTTPKYILTEEQAKYLERFMKVMLEEVRNPNEYSVQVLQSYLNILLYKLKLVIKSDSEIISNNRFSYIAAKYEELITMSNGDFRSVAEYSSMLNISAVYLSECVKKATGRNPQEILTDFKVQYAKSLLCQSKSPVTDIAWQVGFNEVTNFTKFFKANTGLTPSQFRKIRR
ncbi:AraC family transcriptional regulator [Puteibacter caeruleilacunae]|nr:AraC family transcriptional regulator [Puteibacter caeruleilacunae]